MDILKIRAFLRARRDDWKRRPTELYAWEARITASTPPINPIFGYYFWKSCRNSAPIEWTRRENGVENRIA
jgi:hypothetical protein